MSKDNSDKQLNAAEFARKISHIVVVMLENRSLDNLCGWLYADSAPKLVLPAGSPPQFDGLNPTMWNPSNSSYFKDAPPQKVFVTQQATNTCVPNPDPEETFDNVTYQLYGPSGKTAFPNQGFLVNYQETKSTASNQIMDAYSPAQLPVLSALARNYAISDAWFCSVPSQTWPNRAFVHAGTSNGHVNNGAIPDPLTWNVPTIFGALESAKKTWAVYSDTDFPPIESLTRGMFRELWPIEYEGHFQSLGHFTAACAAGALPQYSFIEPNFGTFSRSSQNDFHPPSDVVAGDAFLGQIWKAVSTSPAFKETLLIITFDEHGGTFDHVLPPGNAVPPDAVSNPGEEGFAFNRFGVRVPAILVSPYIQAGTVFRSDAAAPLDHTAILATLRDWLQIPQALMPQSARIEVAPNLFQVLSSGAARTDVPQISIPLAPHVEAAPDLLLNDLQRSVVSAIAIRYGMAPAQVLQEVGTRGAAVDFRNKLTTVTAGASG